LESPPLFKVLFLIARALARSATPPSNAADCATPGTGPQRGFTLTGDVTLPPGTTPAAVIESADGQGTSVDDHPPLSGQYAEMSGTICASADCTTSVTLNFHQAGRPVRIFSLTGITGTHGSGSPMNCKYPPLQDDDTSEAPG
jgi:hypothetical protein